MTVWYTARGAGLAALLALTVATALGALGAVKVANPATRVVMQYVHRTAAALGLSLLVLHVSMILLDAQAGVGVVGALVPFASGYRPNTVALGSLALYTFLLVAALGAARGRLTRSERSVRLWRRTHTLSYVGWGLAMLHGFRTGTDTGRTWTGVLYLAGLAVVLGSLAARAVTTTRAKEPIGALR